ncbi:hypothetical protein OC842_003338 [Tilletia horrida]|uniref:Uncharacterized protein n=1 Tax=Tilletia horrida TaxID=155126 RepID=A0AAN6GCZ7_9BASI|nr:hypothetical protein OC842_003338 [Tilletia horrida]
MSTPIIAQEEQQHQQHGERRSILTHLEAVLTASFIAAHPLAAVQLLVHTLTVVESPSSCHPCIRHALLRTLVSHASTQLVDQLLLDPRGARLVFDWMVLEDSQLGKHDAATGSANMLCRLLGLASSWLSAQQIATAAIISGSTQQHEQQQQQQLLAMPSLPTHSSSRIAPLPALSTAAVSPVLSATSPTSLLLPGPSPQSALPLPLSPSVSPIALRQPSLGSLWSSPTLLFLRTPFTCKADMNTTITNGKPTAVETRTALSIVQRWSRGSSFSLKRSAAVLLRRGSEVDVIGLGRPPLAPLSTTASSAVAAGASRGPESSASLSVPMATVMSATLPSSNSLASLLKSPTSRSVSLEHGTAGAAVYHCSAMHAPGAHCDVVGGVATAAAAAAAAAAGGPEAVTYSAHVTGSGSSANSGASSSTSSTDPATLLSLPALSPSTYDISLLTGSGASSLASIAMPALGFSSGIALSLSQQHAEGPNKEDATDACIPPLSATSACAFPPVPCATESFPRPMSSKYELAIFEYEAARREWAVNGMPPEVAARYQAWLKDQHAQAQAQADAAAAAAATTTAVAAPAGEESAEEEAQVGEEEEETAVEESDGSAGVDKGKQAGKGKGKGKRAEVVESGSTASSSQTIQWAETDMDMRTPGQSARPTCTSAAPPRPKLDGSTSAFSSARTMSSSYLSDAEANATMTMTPLTTLASSTSTPVPVPVPAPASHSAFKTAAAATPTTSEVGGGTGATAGRRKRKLSAAQEEEAEEEGGCAETVARSTRRSVAAAKSARRS